MYKIIQYKVFKNNKELKDFQTKYKIGIVSISPFVSKMGLDYSTNDAKCNNDISVFVVYHERDEDE